MATTAAIGAAEWLLGKVVSKLADHALEAWAATKGLGDNVSTLNKELLYVHSVLKGTQGRDMSGNPYLDGLLQQLGQLTDEADDMLDELEYFRIQDELDGTQEAADQPGDGLLHDAGFHARHAARSVATKCLPCLSASERQGHQRLRGGCIKGLASGLHRLTNLKVLKIKSCREIRSLPKEGLPSSLQHLDISVGVSNELERECRKLRNILEIKIP